MFINKGDFAEMKKLLLGSSLATVLLAGCIDEKESSSAEADSQSEQTKTTIVELQNNLTTTQNELVKMQVKLIELESSMNRPKVTGKQIVNASELYVRTGSGIEHAPVGIALYNAPIEVVDSTNAWYKVKVNLEGLTVTEEEGLIIYSDKKGEKFKFYSNQKDLFEQLNSAGELYVHGNFITQTEDVELAKTTVPENPKNPFVYGLTFYDAPTKDIMEKKIWATLETDLRNKGFDGIKVTYIDRETFTEDMEKEMYDAVENAPGDLVKVNKQDEEPTLIVFGKTLDESTRNAHYRGIVIVNKDSGINDFDDLVGRKIATGKEYSESGFKYQNYYLKNAEGIDIQEEATLIQDYSHQEILFVVATGKLDAGFVGDFVLTDPYHELSSGASQVGLDLTSQAQLEELRKNVTTIPYDGSLNPIPNNPHSLRADLAADKTFIEKLHKVVEGIYLENKEGFDLTSATNDEYEFLRQFQEEE